MPTFGDLSEIHMGKRWQVAKCRASDPDEFAKDIYFGVLKTSPQKEGGAPQPATAEAGEDSGPGETDGDKPETTDDPVANDSRNKEGDYARQSPEPKPATSPSGDGADNAEVSKKTVSDGAIAPSPPADGESSVEPDEIAFKNRVEQTMSTLKAIYRPVEPREVRSGFIGLFDRLHNLAHVRTDAQRQQRITRFNEAYDRLFSLAALGLGSNDTEEALRRKVTIASGALDGLRADVRAREAAWIKNGYMRKLGLPALMAGLVFVLMFFIYEKSPGFVTVGCNAPETIKWLLPSECTPEKGGVALFPNEIYRFRNVFLLMAGCMMGTWASFAARNVILTFDDLAELEQDSLSPTMRLTFTGVLTLIFALTFLTGMIQVEIGGFKTVDLTKSGTVAFLAGAFFGLIEQRLPAAIMDRASGFLNAASGK